MNYRSVVVLICGLLAVEEVSHATIAVIYYTQEKIIMASDSRGMFTSGRGPDDTQCKVTALGGQVLFVSAGLGGWVRRRTATTHTDMVPEWTNLELARAAYHETSNPQIENVATQWMQMELTNLRALYSVSPQSLLEVGRRQRGSVVDAIFGGVGRNGKLNLLTVAITIDAHGYPISNYGGPVAISCEDTANFCAIGDNEILREFVQQKTPRAKKEARTWKPSPRTSKRDVDVARSVRFVELTIGNQKARMGDPYADVGGKVDAVEIDRDGSVRWYRRKPNCPANQ